MAMDQKNELKSMIMRFRVIELHSLFTFLQIRVSGLRKRELQKKAIREIEKHYSSVLCMKIRSIYKTMMGQYDDELLPSDLEDCDPSFGSLHGSDIRNFLNNLFIPSSAETHLYTDENPKSNHVKFNELTFYNYVSDILALTPLVPRKCDSNLCGFDMPFRLNRETLNQIQTEGSRYKILLRFCVLNNEVQLTDHLPPTLTVKVNFNYCSLPSTSSSKQAEAKLYCPIDITSYVEKNKSMNSMTIEWVADYCTTYGITIQLMQQHTAEDLVNKLKAKGERDPSISKTFIYATLNDEEDEIATTSLKMSLTCPLGKVPITLPTRATTCNHLQCFDGILYIKMNEVKSTWQCPVCYKKSSFEDLFVDGYFMEILRSDKFKNKPTDIQINQDGSWEPVEHSENIKSRSRGKITDCDVKETPRTSNLKGANNSQAEIDAQTKASKTSRTDDSLNNADPYTFINDLRDFFLNYDNVYSDNSQRPSISMLPTFNNTINETAKKHRRNASSSDCLAPPKKKILLVDLTASDSESDVESVSSTSVSSSDTTVRSSSFSPQSTRPPTPTYDSQPCRPMASLWTPLPNKYPLLSNRLSIHSGWDMNTAPTSSYVSSTTRIHDPNGYLTSPQYVPVNSGTSLSSCNLTDPNCSPPDSPIFRNHPSSPSVYVIDSDSE